MVTLDLHEYIMDSAIEHVFLNYYKFSLLLFFIHLDNKIELPNFVICSFYSAQ